MVAPSSTFGLLERNMVLEALCCMYEPKMVSGVFGARKHHLLGDRIAVLYLWRYWRPRHKTFLL